MEIIPATALKRLPFSPEPLSQWNDATDLLHFLYEIYDKPTLMVLENGTKISGSYRDYGEEVYKRGQENFQLLIKQFELAAQKAPPAPGAATQTITVPDFSNESIFGKAAKYVIAWNGVIEEVLSESAFFSLAHVLESQEELKSSILLASNLYYKQASEILRSFLEELVLPIYFCDHPNKFADWKSNNYHIPPLRDRNGKKGLLSQLVEQKKLSQKLKDEISDLYGELNTYIHGSEGRLIHKGLFTGKWMGHVFKSDDFCKWCEYICRSVDVGIQLLITNINQWGESKIPGQVICPICHNQKDFNTESIEHSRKLYTYYYCCQCGHKMILEQSKLIQKIQNTQTGESWVFE